MKREPFVHDVKKLTLAAGAVLALAGAAGLVHHIMDGTADPEWALVLIAGLLLALTAQRD